MRATVEKTTVAMGEHVIYTLEVEGTSLPNIVTPSPPATEGLSLVHASPSTTRRASIINGVISQSLSFHWTYRPTRAGQARIDAAEITVDGRRIRTEPIHLTVLQQSQRSPSARGNPPGTPGGDDEPSFTSQDLFIRAIPSTRTAYPNQQITLEYRLFFRYGIQLRQSRLADSWDADGFWREDLDIETRPIPEVTVQNGLRYNSIVLKRVALFPTRTGRLTIEPLRIETEAYTPYAGSAWDRFFSLGGDVETLELESPPVTIDVQPLPPGAPPTFSGAVGDFRMNVDVGRTDLTAGDPLEISVRISGTGNLTTLTAPDLRPPGAFEQYPPQSSTNINRRATQIQGTRTFTYVLVPRTNGHFEIPPVAFTYLDPKTGRYETLTDRPIEVEVTGAPENLANEAVVSELPVDDIAGIIAVPGEWIDLNRTPLHRNGWAYAALLLPLAALGGAVVFQRHRKRMTTDETFARSRRAHPVARRHLKHAANLAHREDPRAFYEEVDRAVLGFLGNRLNVPERGLTRQSLREMLAARGLSETRIGDLQSLLDECDRARFAPGPLDREAMQTALTRAEALIADIDRLATHASPSTIHD